MLGTITNIGPIITSKVLGNSFTKFAVMRNLTSYSQSFGFGPSQAYKTRFYNTNNGFGFKSKVNMPFFFWSKSSDRCFDFILFNSVFSNDQISPNRQIIRIGKALVNELEEQQAFLRRDVRADFKSDYSFISRLLMSAKNQIGITRVVRREHSEICGGYSGSHCDCAQGKPSPANYYGPKTPFSRFISGIRGIPLSAKIGLSIFATLGAVSVFALGFIGILKGGGNRPKGVAYFALGACLLCLSSLPGW